MINVHRKTCGPQSYLHSKKQNSHRINFRNDTKRLKASFLTSTRLNMDKHNCASFSTGSVSTKRFLRQLIID